jgi:hypothetical protein
VIPATSAPQTAPTTIGTAFTVNITQPILIVIALAKASPALSLGCPNVVYNLHRRHYNKILNKHCCILFEWH